MTDTPIGDAALGATGTALAPRPGGQVATFDRAALEQLLAPYTIGPLEWVRMLLTDAEFPEEATDEIGIGLLAAILSADSSEDALTALDLKRAKKLAGDEPGGHSPLLVITGARAVKSTFDEGASCYAIVDAVIKHSGEKIRFTTGARAVQAAIVKHVAEGWMPFEALLSIRAQPTAKGFHPLNLEAGG